MTKTSGSRSILLALGVGFALATACFDESVLENEVCASNADCGSSQECVRTDYQEMNTTDAFGWCRPKGEGCAVGVQPGCKCLEEGELQICTKHESEMNDVCPLVDGNSCTCVFPSTVDPSVTDNTYCPS